METKVDFERDLSICDVESECIKQASKYVYWSQLAVDAQYRLDEMKTDLDVFEAKLSEQFRNEAIASKSKVTEAHILNKIQCDFRWNDLKRKINEARKECSFLMSIREAFSHRKDMLVALAAGERIERKSNISIKE